MRHEHEHPAMRRYKPERTNVDVLPEKSLEVGKRRRRIEDILEASRLEECIDEATYWQTLEGRRCKL